MAGEEDIKALKVQRAKLKSAITRQCGKIRTLIADENKEEVPRVIAEIKQRFNELEEVHDKIHQKLEDVEAIEESDAYLEELREKKDEACERAECLASSSSNASSVSTTSIDESSRALVEALTMPKVELAAYDGDPMLYHSFMTMFDNIVDKRTSDDSAKLAQLIQYTRGAVKETIQPYILQGGTIGYQLARKVLKEKYGDELLISERLLSSLRSGGAVRNPADLERLYNELNRCQLTLQQMGQVEELRSQRFIASIIDRLQLFRKTKWRKIAIDTRREKGQYPTFANLVEFIQQEVEYDSDPVYGENGVVNYKQECTVTSLINQSKGNAGKSSSFATSQKQHSSRCIVCGEDHKLYMCQSFRNLEAAQRLDIVTDKGLCENCLMTNHVTDKCFKTSRCGIDGCDLKHSRLLHAGKLGVKSHLNASTKIYKSNNAGLNFCGLIQTGRLRNEGESNDKENKITCKKIWETRSKDILSNGIGCSDLITVSDNSPSVNLYLDGAYDNLESKTENPMKEVGGDESKSQDENVNKGEDRVKVKNGGIRIVEGKDSDRVGEKKNVSDEKSGIDLESQKDGTDANIEPCDINDFNNDTSQSENDKIDPVGDGFNLIQLISDKQEDESISEIPESSVDQNKGERKRENTDEREKPEENEQPVKKGPKANGKSPKSNMVASSSKGPAFLEEDLSPVSRLKSMKIRVDDQEIKKSKACLHTVQDSVNTGHKHPFDGMIEYHPNWYRLKRATCCKCALKKNKC